MMYMPDAASLYVATSATEKDFDIVWYGMVVYVWVPIARFAAYGWFDWFDLV